MIVINGYTRFGYVEGLGDEEIPWWIAPYVRDFAALAKSSAALEAARAGGGRTPAELRLLTARLTQAAAVARIAVHAEGGKQLVAGIGKAIRDDLDEFCGTPPRPPLPHQAALVVALVASSLEARDPAKALFVAEAERLQRGP